MNPNEIVMIHSDHLRVDPLTRRPTYDPIILKQIEEDMSERGYRKEHPLVVRPDHERGKGYWKITCGQHRLEAGLNAGITIFPCIKKQYQNDIEAISEAYKDNNLACRPDAITEAEYFERLGRSILKDRGHTDSSIDSLKRKYPKEEIALQVGQSLDYVKHRLKLLELPEFVKWMVRRFYQHSQKGQKLSPTIAEELCRIQDILRMQRRANPEDRFSTIEAVRDLAVKFSREKTTLHEARIIATEIGYQSYKKWASKEKPINDEGHIRCAQCGIKIPNTDNPWVPYCIEHKYNALHKSSTLRNNPNIPLHVKNPDLHEVKGVTILYKKKRRLRASPPLRDRLFSPKRR